MRAETWTKRGARAVWPRPGRFHPFGRVHPAGLEQRAEWLARRSIKSESKLWALRRSIALCDLTTLEGCDTEGKVRDLCAKARMPYRAMPGMPATEEVACPQVAAVCVYPNLIPVAKRELEGSHIRVAAVAAGFPSGQYPFGVRLRDLKEAVSLGADEVDMVMNRNAFLAGEYATVYREVAKAKEVCGAATLKVILETGELGDYDAIRNASFILMQAGADFVKTSTGKVQPGATLPVSLCMMEAIRDYADRTGRRVGLKPAGGIRTAKDAVRYLVMAKETLGEEWLSPDLFRFGASALLNDLTAQIVKQLTGVYRAPAEFSEP